MRSATIPRRAWLELIDPQTAACFAVCKQPMVSSCEVLRVMEDALEDDSFIALSALPHAQALTAEFLRAWKRAGFDLGGNSWLFHQPDVTYSPVPDFEAHRWRKCRARTVEESGGTDPP